MAKIHDIKGDHINYRRALKALQLEETALLAKFKEYGCGLDNKGSHQVFTDMAILGELGTLLYQYASLLEKLNGYKEAIDTELMAPKRKNSNSVKKIDEGEEEVIVIGAESEEEFIRQDKLSRASIEISDALEDYLKKYILLIASVKNIMLDENYTMVEFVQRLLANIDKTPIPRESIDSYVRNQFETIEAPEYLRMPLLKEVQEAVWLALQQVQEKPVEQVVWKRAKHAAELPGARTAEKGVFGSAGRPRAQSTIPELLALKQSLIEELNAKLDEVAKKDCLEELAKINGLPSNDMQKFKDQVRDLIEQINNKTSEKNLSILESIGEARGAVALQVNSSPELFTKLRIVASKHKVRDALESVLEQPLLKAPSPR